MELNINLERNRYYTGKRIDKEDLLLEQNYFIDKVKTINKMLVGYGIISGLKIDEFKNDSKSIIINKGIGIDNHGNFITLLNKKTYSLPQKLVPGDYIYLKYIDSSKDMVPVGDIESCSESCTSNHISEDTEIFISKKLLVPSTRNICTKKDAARNDEDIKEALLFLGEYKVFSYHNLKRGSIDISERKYIYTNDEIFKLLCNINQNHVSSVNGEKGDLTLVSALGDALPNEEGLINLVAGNNIKIESDDNEIKISTKGGFHKDYYFSLASSNSENNKKIINHNRATFPTVDIYERVLNTGNRLVRENELNVEARDLSMDVDEYKTTNKIVPFNKTVEKASIKNLIVSDTLKLRGIDEVSAKVLKVSENKLEYYINDLYIVPLFSYKKVLGSTNNINIEVTHVNSNRVVIKNLSSTSIDILAILST